MLLDNLSQFIRRGGGLKENYIGSKQMPPESINLGALVTGIDHRLLSDSIQVIFWCCAKKKASPQKIVPPGRAARCQAAFHFHISNFAAHFGGQAEPV